MGSSIAVNKVQVLLGCMSEQSLSVSDQNVKISDHFCMENEQWLTVIYSTVNGVGIPHC